MSDLKGRIYRLTILDAEGDTIEDNGIDKIAFTNCPRIITKGVAFSENADFIQKKVVYYDEPKQRIAAPVMIPGIVEYDDYYTEFTVEEIERCYTKFMNNLDNKGYNFNDSHKNIKKDSFVYETWKVEDPKTDKSFVSYGIEVPKGTWFMVSQVRDKAVFEKLVEEDKVGYSIEGMFGMYDVTEEYSKKEFSNKNKNENIKMEENTMKLPAGEHTIGDKIYVVDETGNVVEIKDVVEQSTDTPTTEEDKKVEMSEVEVEVETEDKKETEDAPVAEEDKPVEMAEDAPVAEEPKTFQLDEAEVLAIVQPKLDELLNMIAELKVQLENKEDKEDPVVETAEQEMSFAQKSVETMNKLLNI